MSEIVFEGVTRRFPLPKGGDFLAIDRIDLTIEEKEFVAIVGPSGCGKTTLMRMAAGLDFPTDGRVLVGGKEVKGPGPERAVVFQQFALLPWKTVRENIGFGLMCKGTPKAEAEAAIARYVDLMGLTGHEDSFPHQLSGGMQQRVAIARAYVMQPAALLMDEPFGALDAQTRIVMQEELVRLARRNPRTVIFITHAVDEAIYLADRVVVMGRKPGRIIETIDIRPLREDGGWEALPIEEVMDTPDFTHMRSRIWKLLKAREQERPAVPAPTPAPVPAK
ncbi:ABC transporter ATP-binding protein [Falsiroseomonas oryzae]|uniref:ABC transporter ATP-binding protein n=1 Tax=Falsiroseomonas oryzae TaxID=2766473 RepID=UPI0022EA6A0F|nr:ABC transporter ATP-binding protein [Roseomonas sp. MO-31]